MSRARTAAAASLVLLSAWAPSAFACPDLSGIYVGADEAQEINRLSLKQKGCASISFTHEVRTGSGAAEVTSQEWVMDGTCRDVAGSPGLCLTHRWDGRALVNRGFMRIAGKASPIPSYLQRLTGSTTELVSEALLFDLTGMSLGSTERVTYRRERR